MRAEVRHYFHSWHSGMCIQHSLCIPHSQWQQQQQATQQHNLIQSYDLNNMLLLRFFQLNSVRTVFPINSTLADSFIMNPKIYLHFS